MDWGQQEIFAKGRLSSLGLLVAMAILPGCQTSLSVSGFQHVAYVPTAHVVVRGTSFTGEGGGYGIVLLRRGNPERNARACRMMSSLRLRMGAADGRPEMVDGVAIYHRPIYWPVIRQAASLRCDRLVREYDHDRAQGQLQRLTGSQSLGQGPFVIIRTQNGQEAGLFDFSAVAREDFDIQFLIVTAYLSQRSDFWDNARHEASYRLWFRQLVLERTGMMPSVLFSFLQVS